VSSNVDIVRESGPERLAPRIRLTGMLELPQIPAERPSMEIRQQQDHQGKREPA
jgi:hypothetical protein